MASRPLGSPVRLKLFSWQYQDAVNLFHCIDSYADGAEATVKKTTHALAQIKVVLPRGLIVTAFFTAPDSREQRTLPVSFKKVLDEAIEMIHFVKSQPSSTCLFHIYVMKRGICIKNVLAWSTTFVSKERYLCHCWVTSYTNCFYHETLLLLERMAETNYSYSDLGIWQTFTQK